eukprot:CAMPEP_0178399418 /NCGR_PEP_ID=MMETSP0689_2-20121128/15271_1 /TAXON_ID=160604 /ORGANISM="Amphidinium massartii, Strain CS-259" /LENGTH=720 /DNA_ID=CAMNT_0020020197 /DNA_START=77 /DNA_END=2239 /DNA_ORIENTATION=-
MKAVLCAALLLAAGISSVSATEASANPIRRVVKMLQSMTTKIEAEAEKEEELYKKYMCYCKTSSGTLEEGIAAAETKIPKMESALEEAKSQKASLEQQLKEHKAGREEAGEALANADSLREKEAAEFAEESAELTANIDALTKAIKAISTGMGSFLQTGAAQALRRLTVNSASLNSADRDILMSFLDQGSSSGYAPASGQIVGILKVMKDEMEKDLADITEAEEAAKKNQAALKAAKEKELAAHTAAIEEKTARSGKLGVEIAELANDLEDTQETLDEDKKFLGDLEANCDTKDKEWEQIEKMRADEKLALAETIKILNDDDALELFKKTLPSPSLMQITTSSREVAQRALAMIKKAPTAHRSNRAALDLIAMALTGKKISFEKVFTLIDELVGVLAKEQVDDDKKKEYCEAEFDTSEDKIKGLETTIADVKMAIDETKDTISTLKDEIEALTKGIEALDKEVAESTETRKEEHEAYTELLAQDGAAKELLGVAKNRLQKFYNPKLYKAPPKQELTEEEQIEVNFGGTPPPTEAPGGIAGTGVMALVQLHSFNSDSAAPPPPPESFAPYAKKAQMSNGVMALMDMLIADLDKEMQTAEVDEKNAQEEYEKFMADAAEKRALDSKAITDKEEAKASAEADLEKSKEEKKAKKAELMATEEYLSDMHSDCDWLLKNYGLRKEARAAEVESLKSAKAVLAGADYSLVQRGHFVTRALRGGRVA